MRLSQAPPTLLSLLFTVLLHTENVGAIPFSFDFLHARGGSGNCGAQLQYTCESGEGCFTTSDVAYCSATVAGAATGYGVYTTTYTETDLVLRTSTYTSAWAVATGVAICATESAQTSCGAICCASTQGCYTLGSCTELATSLWDYSTMPVPTVTNTVSSASAPLRPTSGASTTASATTTVPFISPATASGSVIPITGAATAHKGLSAGAIAGIVIGVLAGIVLLLLLCFCCLGIKIFEGILGIFGIGGKKKRRSTTERIETTERYSRHGSGTASRRDEHKTWYGGTRPTRVTERKEKKSSGLGGLGAVGAGLAGLALILGLKRKNEKKVMVERSDIGSTYYTDSYTGTSESKSTSFLSLGTKD